MRLLLPSAPSPGSKSGGLGQDRGFLGQDMGAWGRTEGPWSGQGGPGAGQGRLGRGPWDRTRGPGARQGAWGRIRDLGKPEWVRSSCPDSSFMATGRSVNILCLDLLISWVLCLTVPPTPKPPPMCHVLVPRNNVLIFRYIKGTVIFQNAVTHASASWPKAGVC